jgi:hypothetical protein
MRKEVIFAIISGILFGLVIAFGVLRANSAIKTSNEEIATEKLPEKNLEIIKDVSVTITKPENHTVVETETVSIEGISSPNSRLLISDTTDDYLLLTNANGFFEQEIELDPSINYISIAVFDEKKDTQQLLLELVYSSEFFKQLEPDDAASESSDSADSISERVEKKLNLAVNKPKFYAGTITDLTEDTIQLKNVLSEIQQVSISDKTTYVDNKKNSKAITFTDIAIGDYAVFLGFANGDNVLLANRVLITNPNDDSNKKIIFGTLETVEGKTATVNTNGETFTATFGKRWNGPEINELVIGEKFIMVAIKDDKDNFIIRTIEPLTQISESVKESS